MISHEMISYKYVNKCNKFEDALRYRLLLTLFYTIENNNSAVLLSLEKVNECSQCQRQYNCNSDMLQNN